MRAPTGVGAAPNRSRRLIQYKMTEPAGRWVHENSARLSDYYGNAIEIDVRLAQGADGFRTATFDGADVHE